MCAPLSTATATGTQWASIAFAAPAAVGAVYFVNRQDAACGSSPSCGGRIVAGGGTLTINTAAGAVLSSYILGASAVTQALASPIVLPVPLYGLGTTNATAQRALVRFVVIQVCAACLHSCWVRFSWIQTRTLSRQFSHHGYHT